MPEENEKEVDPELQKILDSVANEKEKIKKTCLF